MKQSLSRTFMISLAFTLLFTWLAYGQEGKSQIDQSEIVSSAIKQGEWLRATEEATEWTRKEPKSAIAIYVLDIAQDILDHKNTPLLTQYDFPYSDKGAMKNIESWIKFLLKKDPNNPNFLLLNAMLYSPKAFNDANESVRLFKQAIATAPNNVFALNGLGAGYGAQGKYEFAIETLQKAIALNPKSSTAYTNLGVAFLKNGDTSKAEQMLKKAAEANRIDPIAWFNLGSFYAERGRNTEAQPALEKAIELMPKLLEARWNLGGIYYKSGKRNKAVEQLKEMVKIAPDSPMGQRAKQMLNSLGE
jgi:Flp pilus assembly protein TadD